MPSKPHAPTPHEAVHAFEHWSSRRGFILAAIGAAVGVGNIWRFSYVAGENGGAAFLLVYVACVILVGLPLVIGELAVGRNTHGDALLSVRAVSDRPIWLSAGALGIFGSFLLLSFYLVIAGWALKYLAGSLTGELWRLAGHQYGGYFADFIADPVQPAFWQLVMAALSAAIVACGIRVGVERVNGILMPLLAAIIVALAIFALTLDGASRGLAFLFSPRWEALSSPDLYVAAMGQAFFSVGLGMALYLTYGSYLPRGQNIPGMATAVVAGDTAVAILAGIAIFPAVFTYGLDPASGPQLVFITLPQIFLAMPAGELVAAVFFLLLVAAALTSAVSLVEVIGAWVRRRFGLSRPAAAAAVAFIVYVCGLPSSLGYGLWQDVQWNGRGILESVDFMVSNVVLPVSGLMTALLVGWAWRSSSALREADFNDTALGRAWLFALRWVTPALIAIVLVRGFGTE
jgi:NSS family neurotransmitter:Na+ symporter